MKKRKNRAYIVNAQTDFENMPDDKLDWLVDDLEWMCAPGEVDEDNRWSSRSRREKERLASGFFAGTKIEVSLY